MTTSLHSAQLDLLGARPALFSGWTYRKELDQARLSSMLRRVLFALLDGRWWTLPELRAECGGTEPGISARVRDLRKRHFGGFTVHHRRRHGLEKQGVWEYRLATGLLRKEQLDAIFGPGSPPYGGYPP